MEGGKSGCDTQFYHDCNIFLNETCINNLCFLIDGLQYITKSSPHPLQHNELDQEEREDERWRKSKALNETSNECKLCTYLDLTDYEHFFYSFDDKGMG